MESPIEESQSKAESEEEPSQLDQTMEQEEEIQSKAESTKSSPESLLGSPPESPVDSSFESDQLDKSNDPQLEYTHQTIIDYYPTNYSISPFADEEPFSEEDSILNPHEERLSLLSPIHHKGQPHPSFFPKEDANPRRWTVANQDLLPTNDLNRSTRKNEDISGLDSSFLNEPSDNVSSRPSMMNSNPFLLNPDALDHDKYESKNLFDYKPVDLTEEEDPELLGSQKDIYQDNIENKLKKNLKPIIEDLKDKVNDINKMMNFGQEPLTPLLQTMEKNMTIDPSLLPFLKQLLEICHHLKDLLNAIRRSIPSLIANLLDTIPRITKVYDDLLHDILNERIRIIKQLEEKHQIVSFRKIRVYVRVRPPLVRQSDSMAIDVLDTQNLCLFNETLQERRQYKFLRVFDMDSTQSDVYKHIYKGTDTVLNGRDTCFVFYGQINSGKSYTLFGDSKNKGVLWHMLNDLYQKQDQYLAQHQSSGKKEDKKSLITCSLVEIHDEKTKDLLFISDQKSQLIRRNKNSKRVRELVKNVYDHIKIRSIGDNIYLEKLTQKECTSADECWNTYNYYLNKRNEYSFIEGNLNESHLLYIVCL